ncbi:MAG TPA: sigma 54-interacting transcriptional regulator [Vicinamibacteria bacterium]|nr:sigma 54-interacting transcriptional regulator [Vicinamibacteria bacterium]
MRDHLSAALARIALAAPGTLERRDFVTAVGEAAVAVLPFDSIAVLLYDGPQSLMLYSLAGTLPRGSGEGRVSLDDFSPGIRPERGGRKRIDDLEPVLSPAHKVDAWWGKQGLRSAAWAAIEFRGRTEGFLYVTSRSPGAFGPAHEVALGSIATVLALALEHERLSVADLARRRRLDAVDQLLPTLATALDVREVFDRVSQHVQPALGHDRIVLASQTADGRTATVHAAAGGPDVEIPSVIDLGAGPCPSREEWRIVPDFEEETDESLRRVGAVEQMRSGLFVRLWAEPTGSASLVFLSRQPRQFCDDDLPVAQKVAAYVSLALSHQRLAEEHRRAAAVRERASQLEDRVERLRQELDGSRGPARVVGRSKAWTEVLAQAAKVARAETTVLLTGESGTGKEVIARFIHRGSPRANGPFTALNCAALPEQLLESELFGYERGAFTGATAAKAGRIQQAEGGLLFLDEIGETTPALQVKLLRVLQEREYQRLGGTRPIKADVRIVAATNRDLEKAMARGDFREDLYYRLCVFQIHLPPLRERREDILPLAEAFLQEISGSVARPAEGISREAEGWLLSYDWPGNVRELRNVLERATILCDGGLITTDHLPHDVAVRAAAGVERKGAAAGDELDLDRSERELVVRALEATGDNRTQAARLLGLTRPQLYRRLRKHGLAATRRAG